MCGFVIYKKQGNNEFIKYRGPDMTNELHRHNFNFIHNLLSVTGEFTSQPYIDGEIVCLYNGEIYNQPYAKSDGEVLIPLYKNFGYDFPKHLDGEFAIAIYDFEAELAIFVTDPFATKPLWIHGIECASYYSGVGGLQLAPNTILIKDIPTGEEVFKDNYHKWDWNQYKSSYDDWIKAFSNAIKKRAVNGCFIGLSSGYDSGAIHAELLKREIAFKSFSIMNNENKETIKKRITTGEEFEELEFDFKKIKEMLQSKMEKVPYYFGQEKQVLDDVASVGLGAICQKAGVEGRKVLLSGQGADEIIGDYALYPKQSNFKGIFPQKLTEWQNFANGFQRDYLNKEEYVAGAFGIETRYPFLDQQVVQEFLWLSTELKNRHYKAPLYEYLTRNNVPFDENVKKGFRPISI